MMCAVVIYLSIVGSLDGRTWGRGWLRGGGGHACQTLGSRVNVGPALGWGWLE